MSDQKDKAQGLLLKLPVSLQGEILILPSGSFQVSADMTEENILLSFQIAIKALQNLLKHEQRDINFSRTREGNFKKAIDMMQHYSQDLMTVLEAELREKAASQIEMAQTGEIPLPPPPTGGKVIKLPTP